MWILCRPKDWEHKNYCRQCEWRNETSDSMAQLPHPDTSVLNRLQDCLNGYLLQNFKKAIIQKRDPSKPTPPVDVPLVPRFVCMVPSTQV